MATFEDQLNPPINNLDEFEKSFLEITNLELPKELRSLFCIGNGSKRTVCKYYSILSSDQLIDSYKSWKKIFDEWLLEELKVHESDGGKTLPMYTTPYWIPFMTDGNGNYIAIDYAPGKKGIQGQIIVFGADEQIIKVLANDLTEFFELLKNDPNPLSEHIQA